MAANTKHKQQAAGRIPAGKVQKTKFFERFFARFSRFKPLTVIKLVLLAALVYLQAILWIGEGSLADVRRLKQSIAELEQKNKQLQERNQLLIDEVDALRNGLDLIEHRAREELGFIKEDEVFYHIIKKQAKTERNEQKK
jgi:cell division protein FtsB